MRACELIDAAAAEVNGVRALAVPSADSASICCFGPEHPLVRGPHPLRLPIEPGDDLREILLRRARVHDRHAEHSAAAEVGGGDPAGAGAVVRLAQLAVE